MEAMDKIRDEMAKNQNPAIQELGEALTAWLSRHPEGAEKILAEGKTLAGSYKHLEDYAKKHGNRNGACVPDWKAMEVCAEYWGINKQEMLKAFVTNMLEKTGAAEEPQAHAQEKPAAGSLDLDLDALLGGL